MAIVKRFKLKLSASLVDEIMNAFKGTKNTIDQRLLRSFYFEEYPETTKTVLSEKQIKRMFKIMEEIEEEM